MSPLSVVSWKLAEGRAGVGGEVTGGLPGGDDAGRAGTSLSLTWAETDGLLASEKLPGYCFSPAPQAPSRWASWPLLSLRSQSHRHEEESELEGWGGGGPE